MTTLTTNTTMDVHIIAGTCEIPTIEEFLLRLNDIASSHGITVQAIDAGKTAGEEHIIAAVEKAVRATARSYNISNDLGMEIMLYASGNRQIKRALAMGVKTGRNDVVIIAVGENIPNAAKSELASLVVAADVMKYRHEKRDTIVSFFGITESEIATVGEAKIPKLVIERVALMGLWK